MSAYIWSEGRLLGFDAVEWGTLSAAVALLALVTLTV